MNVRSKLLLGAGLLALIPIVLTAGLIGTTAFNSATESLNLAATSKLTAIRENRRGQIEEYLSTLSQEVNGIAQTELTITAFKGLREGFASVVKETNSEQKMPAMKARLADYYAKDFSTEFANRNPAAAPSMEGVLEKLDSTSRLLQHTYIAASPEPLGKKEQFVDAADGSKYARVHSGYHPSFETLQKKLGYYDIFLIDATTNRVVYTVFKELDFASDLATGIAANTGLADVAKRAAASKNKDDVFLSDYAPYLASYNDQAAFIATPIFEDNNLIGVLAVQVPLDKISAVMTTNKKWVENGFGDSGEAYLVGGDKLMRSDARLALEKKDAYLTAFKAGGGTPALVDSVRKKNSTIGVQKISSEAVASALQGKTGTTTGTDFLGRTVLSAYAPLKVLGLTWAIVAQQDTTEVLAPVISLRNNMLVTALITALTLLALAGIAIFFFVRRFMLPIAQLQTTVQKVAKGDFTARARIKSNDEMQTLGGALDNLLDDRISALAAAEAENDNLNNSVIGLLSTVADLSQRDLTVKAAVTEDIIGTVGDSINQLTDATATVLREVTQVAGEVEQSSLRLKEQSDAVNLVAAQERDTVSRLTNNLIDATDAMNNVARLANSSNEAAADASRSTENALLTVQTTVRGMDAIRETISEMEKRIKRLGERSQEISQIVNLINTISERTHVLSLNASMQAAMAGDAGRGFAVVAEEVQRLAENSRQATAQIASLVQNIQIETNDTIATVNKTIDQVVQGSDLARASGVKMTETRETTLRLVQLVETIAKSSGEQVRLAVELSNAAAEITASTEKTATQLAAQNVVTSDLMISSKRLVDSVSVFRLPSL